VPEEKAVVPPRRETGSRDLHPSSLRWTQPTIDAGTEMVTKDNAASFSGPARVGRGGDGRY
jgi:hypothetical protein